MITKKKIILMFIQPVFLTIMMILIIINIRIAITAPNVFNIIVAIIIAAVFVYCLRGLVNAISAFISMLDFGEGDEK